MKILLVGAVRGGRANQRLYADIREVLMEFGDVLSGHIADETLTEYGETEVSKEEIRDREMERLNKCDVVVAEVTTPSLGAGYLIAQALHSHKPLLCVYHGEETYKLSAMIKGDKDVKIFTYLDPKDLEEIFEQELPNTKQTK